MKELRERIVVGCPYEKAEAKLLAFFSALENGDGVTRMRLRVILDGTSLALEREVRVVARAMRDEANLNKVVEIAWEPEGTVMFPRFEGTLSVWSEDDPARSFIELRGQYTPPLGAAGQVFDDAIGFKIAQSTAQQFLNDVKASVEAGARFTL
jgi:hypothetical protein